MDFNTGFLSISDRSKMAKKNKAFHLKANSVLLWKESLPSKGRITFPQLLSILGKDTLPDHEGSGDTWCHWHGAEAQHSAGSLQHWSQQLLGICLCYTAPLYQCQSSPHFRSKAFMEKSIN